VSDFIRNPPYWILAVLVVVLAGHAVDRAIHIALSRSGRNGVIPILEFFGAIVIGLIVLHSYTETLFKSETNEMDWYDSPIILILALIVFLLGSMALYLVSRRDESKLARGRRVRK
jgi:hypothetical protein